ncbi:hypothetical protein M441DRAFT_74327 [Trichoderma asperellum CBS 433.97]|uniref:Transcription factor domain-containing protein n=1 Tax=Trichoderma asperellum (strain ATCC 204424 / CBS 433.97 / NBRC 101777) TaxID=1042311 RepID=A0A2T3YS34_TRIA4|nr:hypothetical protein M441DRAFT_74327 [Trichoderma asperellum CBS 433.97]PTB35378.1 hypothetical protein M441DRAFT_74327 [Trichoderma asperellum CBS 433.97]
MDPLKAPKTNASPSSGSGSNLLFINSAGPAYSRPRDQATTRQIRQHVMRDIGRARRKPRRNPQVNLEVRPSKKITDLSSSSCSCVVAGLNNGCGSCSQLAAGLPLQRLGGPHLPSLPRPFWDQHPLAMMEHNWGMDAFAAYGLALAVNWEQSHSASEFCRNFLTGPEVRAAIHSQTREKSIAFALARSIEVTSCINSRLLQSDVTAATAVNVIHAVMGCICYNFIILEFEQARVHLSGLKLMIATRGGIESLANEKQTLLMLFWVDTISSLIFDTKPRFPMPTFLIPPLPNEELSELLTTLEPNLSILCSKTNTHHVVIASALQDIWSVCKLIRSKLDTLGDDLWREEVDLGTRLNPIAYRLLDSDPHSHTDTPCCMLQALRLGILLWILGVKQKAQSYPGSPASYITRLLERMQSQSMMNLASHLPYFTPYQLWLLFLIATMTLDPADKAVALQLVARIMNERRLAWRDVTAYMKQLPWICGFIAYNESLAAEVELLRGVTSDIL